MKSQSTYIGGGGAVTDAEETAINARLGTTTSEDPAATTSALTTHTDGANPHSGSAASNDARFPTTDQKASFPTGASATVQLVLQDLLPSNYYAAAASFSAPTIVLPADRRGILVPSDGGLRIGNGWYKWSDIPDLDVEVAANWDTTAGTDCTVAANRAGVNMYLYMCQPSSGRVADFIFSTNSTIPDGFTADNSRKIAGFHGLCLSVGTISGHALSGYLTGDVLPASIWDLLHRPLADIGGLVYDEQSGLWYMIYLQSGTSSNTASVFGATITDTRTWQNHVNDLAAIRMRLPYDQEFQMAARGSNKQTNISGGADPVTAGGHSDTAGQRMISDIGLEDCCGAMDQWLADQGYKFNGAADHTHTVDVTGDPQTGVVTSNPSGDVAPAFSWYFLPANEGRIYKQGTYGSVKLRAGGYWGGTSNNGPQARSIYSTPWYAGTDVTARGCCSSRAKA